MNKINEQSETSPNNNAIKFKRQENLPLRNCQNLPLSSSEEMNPRILSLGATTESMEIIRRQKKSAEPRRLVERRFERSKPGMMRRRYQNAQRTIWVPSRPNKRRWEEIAEIRNGRRAHTTRKQIMGRRYQLILEIENDPNQIQIEEQLPENQKKRFGEWRRKPNDPQR